MEPDHIHHYEGYDEYKANAEEYVRACALQAGIC
jgi:hypothetical protein